MFNVNRRLFPLKAHYMFFFAAVSGSIPFLMTYASQLGASPSMIGVLYGSIPFMVLVAKPLLGSIADKFQIQKSIFFSSQAMVVAGFFTIYFIPTTSKVQILNQQHHSLFCQSGDVFLTECPVRNVLEVSSLNCNMSCFHSSSEYFEDNVATKQLLEDENVTFSGTLLFNQSSLSTKDECFNIPVLPLDLSNFDVYGCDNNTQMSCFVTCSGNGSISSLLELFNSQAKSDRDNLGGSLGVRFVMLWICMSVAYVGMGVAVSMADTITLDLLGDDKSPFGLQRLWGSVGWGLFSVVAGKLIDYASQGKKALDFSPGFYQTLLVGLMDLLVISKISVIKTKRPKNIAKNVGQMFLIPQVFLFATAVFCVGMLMGMLWTFLIVYLNFLGASQMLIGLVLAVECFFGEIPFFFVSGWFLEKLGHSKCITLVLFTFGVRFILYSRIQNPWAVLPIELLNGVNFGIFFSALATFSSLIAPPGTSATMQGILQGIFEGFGVGVGSLIGGLLYDNVGGSAMFLICGCAAIGCSFLNGLVNMLLPRQPLAEPMTTAMTEMSREIVEDGVVEKKLLDAGFEVDLK